MQLFDCTLRDGGNVLGNGFPGDLTVMILQGLLDNNITQIEYGNAYGIGAYEADKKTAPLTDSEYLDLAQPFLSRGQIGMFIGVKNTTEKNIALAASKGMKFLRIGANAGDGNAAKNGIALIRKYKMFPRYSLMKGYVLSAKKLAQEAKKLEEWGLGAITIMDSAGTMMPEQVAEYTAELVKILSIPVGFHGHNNLGLSAANAVAAEQNGARDLDCGLLGMARSAGNLPTELAVSLFQRSRKLKKINFLGLLDFIDTKLAPAMAKHDYKAAITPQDLILGVAGCHSNFLGLFKEVAKVEKVSLYQLIIEASKKNRKNPSKEEIIKAAKGLKK
jgi:4-hydroxy-2-oxovalerate aldolase